MITLLGNSIEKFLFYTFDGSFICGRKLMIICGDNEGNGSKDCDNVDSDSGDEDD